ncbi:hypothetical protein CC85DRAFT_288547 [Cutaneotrichosporon oleaginosum]|uniref:Yeast cell wall synthesis Kre9/Knh1-like N-terminal domain-containing protein n=1 Tax=Cutaneotrichosporon oleaginosum TaxID=879819 RepID=A0A0J0XEE7_9TREE|nr:uncharacterized protein CC85DRAFT_288547 [Cutaneotrichosporon oleaginosum]KLT39428.1 hypothetical protein CC85DRAFT_288547 [Cutaneotrichosporon oleaginosum]TXT08434.1 hypothetical protein COLE_05358 [Cutaneotrichosporon oleaginosum]
MFASLLLLAAPASAAVFAARPANSTVAIAGQPFELKWIDDGQKPTLAEMGPTDIDLCVGTKEQHVCIQKVVEDYDMTQNKTTFTPDPSLGEDGQYYLFKYTAGNQYEGKVFEDFSARFFIQGMKGDFNAQADAAIASVQTAPWPTASANPHSAQPPPSTAAAAGAASSSSSGAMAVAAPALAVVVAAGAAALF